MAGGETRILNNFIKHEIKNHKINIHMRKMYWINSDSEATKEPLKGGQGEGYKRLHTYGLWSKKKQSDADFQTATEEKVSLHF